ncbi:MAG: 2-C-methyl-D-erythritol 2,4-cyclodiphosphate synthase [Sphaerochaetaceae bacterium]|nr:2-C-methyl-D-erythritol 2,4-cyclodiphosphate synthase [Sphaerochaetaceae bacterium]
MIRIGTGWDIHKLVKDRPLVLGGIEIESDKGCLGHSDGDALIHAVIDSLLGAAGMEDIGTLFPDTDPNYEGISSVVLLQDVVDMIHSKGYSIVNVDTTVILQSPKLGPYKDNIRQFMSVTLDIGFEDFTVKAKTAEHMLGELGAGDAVVCQSSCLLSKE